jgi:hypothetical protein
MCVTLTLNTSPAQFSHTTAVEGGTMSRKYIDCREMPSERNCDLAMSGSEEHILEAAVLHAVNAHKHEDTPELREQIRGALKDEMPGALA